MDSQTSAILRGSARVSNRARPNKQMQPPGRTVRSSARTLLTDGDQRNLELCGREQDRLQLICNPLDRID